VRRSRKTAVPRARTTNIEIIRRRGPRRFSRRTDADRSGAASGGGGGGGGDRVAAP